MRSLNLAAPHRLLKCNQPFPHADRSIRNTRYIPGDQAKQVPRHQAYSGGIADTGYARFFVLLTFLTSRE
jgi:hypothetical protein